jgi:hypothetical protein
MNSVLDRSDLGDSNTSGARLVGPAQVLGKMPKKSRKNKTFGKKYTQADRFSRPVYQVPCNNRQFLGNAPVLLGKILPFLSWCIIPTDGFLI